MKEKYIIWAFAGAVFLGTLGITSWRHGLRSSEDPGVQLRGAAASHPSNMPEHPFQATATPQATPPPAQATQSPPQSTAGDISPIQHSELTAPDPISEQSRDDYQQRQKLMDEIAARARAQQANPHP